MKGALAGVLIPPASDHQTSHATRVADTFAPARIRPPTFRPWNTSYGKESVPTGELSAFRHLKTTEDLFDNLPARENKSLVAANVQWAERSVRRIDGLRGRLVQRGSKTFHSLL
jgi:hypothetical protein